MGDSSPGGGRVNPAGPIRPAASVPTGKRCLPRLALALAVRNGRSPGDVLASRLWGLRSRPSTPRREHLHTYISRSRPSACAAGTRPRLFPAAPRPRSSRCAGARAYTLETDPEKPSGLAPLICGCPGRALALPEFRHTARRCAQAPAAAPGGGTGLWIGECAGWACCRRVGRRRAHPPMTEPADWPRPHSRPRTWRMRLRAVSPTWCPKVTGACSETPSNGRDAQHAPDGGPVRLA